MFSFRDGEGITQTLLASTIAVLSAVSSSCHATIFANPLVSLSTSYYQSESHRLLHTDIQTDTDMLRLSSTTTDASMNMPIWQYLTHVKTRLAQEAIRCDTYLGQDVKGSLLHVVETTLVGEHVDTIISRGLPPMFDEGRLSDLAILYNLLGRVSALPVLKKEFGEFLRVSSSKSQIRHRYTRTEYVCLIIISEKAKTSCPILLRTIT